MYLINVRANTVLTCAKVLATSLIVSGASMIPVKDDLDEE